MAKAPNNSSKKNKSIVTLIVIVVCIGAILGAKFVMDHNRDQMIQMKTARIKGNPKAAIKIVEYIDFQCPACAAGANKIKEYMEVHPDKIFVEMKYYPLAMHPHSFTSSYYAECALRQGKFWEFHDLLIGRQAMWSNLPEVKSVFDGMAKELELKMAKAPNNSSKKNKPIITLMVVVVCIGAILAVKFVMAKNRDQMIQMKTARVKGNPKAAIKIVEYIDFQCPACAAGANKIKEYMEVHPDKIFVEMKYYPLAMHPHSFTSSYYAECALRQGKFWEFHDLLIGRQAMWSKLPEVKSVFDGMAKELELKMDKLEACVNDEKTKEVVVKTREEGDLLGVKSTPAYFVNNKLIVGSKNLISELDFLLNK